MSETISQNQHDCGYIHVQRNIRPVYPDWVDDDDILYKELECTGFNEYHLGSLRRFVYPKQKLLFLTKGNEIHEWLKDPPESSYPYLQTCLNLQDGYVISEEGVVTYYKFFGRDEGFLWKSMVRKKVMDPKKGLHYLYYVPYLCVRGFKVVILWRWLGDYWIWNNTALCFRTNLERIPATEPLRLCPA